MSKPIYPEINSNEEVEQIANAVSSNSEQEEKLLGRDQEKSITIEDRAKKKGKFPLVVKLTILMAFLFVSVIVVSLVINKHISQDTSTISMPPSFEKSVILISIDAFRWDYANYCQTPNLDLIKSQISSDGFRPPFPSKTFVSHYTMVTGLYPEYNGIVANTFFDPIINKTFVMGTNESLESYWWLGEPIWVTNELQGYKTGCYFWPGSEAKIQDFRPTYYEIYNQSVPYQDRVQKVLDWIDLPQSERPNLITLYFENVDTEGHLHGPLSPEVISAVEYDDTIIGTLIDGLKERDIFDKINLIVVSDHGMATISTSQVIFLDDYLNISTKSIPQEYSYNKFHDLNLNLIQNSLNLEDFQDTEYDATIIDWSPITAILPSVGKEDFVYNALHNVHPNYTVYRKEETPLDLHYNDSVRITPIIGIAALGWSVTTHPQFSAHPDWFQGGNHGFNPFLYPEMTGIFMAHGPAFVDKYNQPVFDNLNLYILLCNILGLNPAPNNATESVIESLLKN
ncbi:ectonucleotide pyrophosphatase/phosphodiesterase [Anaeramoeba ignava]|uniref:Ectonucleotide pyrophosphatase/phosphodiesterase n=1 Tax=Anaeramoeba ignava TaxID=1746090 RepID=A0A9Q0LP77_ANAIG|nr:ectonucleotide pyrophosphatase/phosphodiesterase [Anaeramoeba ignava]